MSRILTGGLETISVRNNWDAISIWHLNQAVSRKEDPRCVTSPDARLTGMGRSPGEGLGTMSSWKHLREEGRHFAKKHRVGAKRALVGVLVAAMTISTMNVPAIAEELGITADAQEQIIQDSTVNTENQSATAEGTPAEGTDATVDEGDDPADTSADAATDATADTQPADDQQPDEAAGAESDQNNLTEGSSENDPSAVEEDTTAQVAVKVANASFKYTDANGAEQTVSENKDAVDFPTQTEIKFSVTANDGFQASRVFYTVDGADTDVAADESGTYTIPAEAVNDGLAITVETAEIPAADEPAADDAAGEADGVATLTINVENSTVTLTNAEGEEQKVSESQDVEVAADEDLALTVEPAEDYELESVTVTDADETSEVSGEDGVYTIPADQVIEGSNIQVSAVTAAKAQAARATTELEIGTTRNVSCNGWHNHKWTSSDTNVATVSTDSGWSGQRGSQTVTAKGFGTANIYCNNNLILTVRVVAKGQATVTFNANGGSGKSVTWTVEPVDDAWAISLPDPSDIGISNEGKTFVGWSTQANGQGSNYIAGIEYSPTQRNTQLYAIWIDPEFESQDNVAFFYIRKDGEIQYEPAAYDGSNYYPGASAETLQGRLYNAVAVNNNLDAVDANLAEVPTEEEIQNVLRRNGVNYDPNNQYIE